MSSSSTWQVSAVVSFYMSAALVMVFVNKAVLIATPDLAFTLLFLQGVIAVILLHVAALFSPKISLPKLDLGVAKKLAPLITIGLLGLVFNTLCLRAVDASFFQIARGLALPMTIIVSVITTRERPTAQVILASAVVTLGFFVGVSTSSLYTSSGSPLQAAKVHVLGISYGVLSSITLAIHAVLIKPAHKYVDDSSIKLAYYVNLGGVLATLPCMVLSGELATLWEQRSAQEWQLFLIGAGVTGSFGFLICIAGLLSIKVTSPVTHMFSSAARNVIQTVLGAVIFGDVITADRCISISILTIGTVYYMLHKSTIATSAKPASLAAPGDHEKTPTTEATKATKG